MPPLVKLSFIYVNTKRMCISNQQLHICKSKRSVKVLFDLKIVFFILEQLIIITVINKTVLAFFFFLFTEVSIGKNFGRHCSTYAWSYFTFLVWLILTSCSYLRMAKHMHFWAITYLFIHKLYVYSKVWFSPHTNQLFSTTEIAFLLKLKVTTEAVSYTHLDVYKRQHL